MRNDLVRRVPGGGESLQDPLLQPERYPDGLGTADGGAGGPGLRYVRQPELSAPGGDVVEQLPGHPAVVILLPAAHQAETLQALPGSTGNNVSAAVRDVTWTFPWSFYFFFENL